MDETKDLVKKITEGIHEKKVRLHLECVIRNNHLPCAMKRNY